MTDQLAGVENDGPSRAGLYSDGLCHDAYGTGLRATCSAHCLPSARLGYTEMFPRLPFSQPQPHSAGMYEVMR